MSASAAVRPDIKPKEPEHKTLAEALSAAQAEFATVVKGSLNPHFKSKYATLPDFLEATRPALSKHGLVVGQQVNYDIPSGTVILTTVLVHGATKEAWTSQYPVIPGKAADPQALGSALTYARRYAYATIVGAVAEDDDDDGNKGSEKEKGKKREPQGETTEGMQFKDVRDEIARAASELEQKGGKTPEAWVKQASSFPAKDSKGREFVKSFSDPHDPSLVSEKWLRGTLAKLLGELSKLEPGAAEGAELLK